ncbi:hypothetical protein ACG3SL_00480 [Sphingomonas sp. CJ20]
MLPYSLWSFAVLGACIYCIARAVIDFRAGKYLWGAVGLVSALALLLTPIQTHAVKIDLPVAGS